MVKRHLCSHSVFHGPTGGRDLTGRLWRLAAEFLHSNQADGFFTVHQYFFEYTNFRDKHRYE